jgi:hypothetical protein
VTKRYRKRTYLACIRTSLTPHQNYMHDIKSGNDSKVFFIMSISSWDDYKITKNNLKSMKAELFVYIHVCVLHVGRKFHEYVQS